MSENRIGHIRLTSHPGSGAKTRFPIRWGAPTAKELGYDVVSYSPYGIVGPKGMDPKVVKVWVPKYDEFVKLQKPWLDEWNKTYGYRQ